MSRQYRIGIITMHKVLNAGSALQAYALCEVIKQLGYDCELIDYDYPNDFHRTEIAKKCFSFKQFMARVKFRLLYRAKEQKMRYKEFWDNNYNLSKNYPSRESIINCPPQYDLYITGSDQVWNPQCMKGDPTFFLDFISNKPKLSYASSFACPTIPPLYEEKYKHFLNQYSAISVRERSGQSIVASVSNKFAHFVCDPTMLLQGEDLARLASYSSIKTGEPYMLAYILSYAYNPYPAIQDLIMLISKEKKLKVKYLLANSVDHYHCFKSISDAGPYDFLKLFQNAAYVVTSSFHGTILSLLFNKQFYSVIPDKRLSDNRIYSLLEEVNATGRAICSSQKIDNDLICELDYEKVTPLLEIIREESLNYLRTAISDALSKCE